MKRERADRHGIYARPDERILARYRSRLGDHHRSTKSFRSFSKGRRSRACIASTSLEQPCTTAILFLEKRVPSLRHMDIVSRFSWKRRDAKPIMGYRVSFWCYRGGCGVNEEEQSGRHHFDYWFHFWRKQRRRKEHQLVHVLFWSPFDEDVE